MESEVKTAVKLAVKTVADLCRENRAARERECKARKDERIARAKQKAIDRKIAAFRQKGCKCAACNVEMVWGNGVSYAFHHVDPNGVKSRKLVKKGIISDLARDGSDERFWREVCVTVLVCGDCHIKIHPAHDANDTREAREAKAAAEPAVPPLVGFLTENVYRECLHNLRKHGF